MQRWIPAKITFRPATTLRMEIDGHRFFRKGRLLGKQAVHRTYASRAHHRSEASRQQRLEKLWQQHRAAKRRNAKLKEYEKMLISSRTPEEVEALQQDPEIQRLRELVANLTRALEDKLLNESNFWNSRADKD